MTTTVSTAGAIHSVARGPDLLDATIDEVCRLVADRSAEIERAGRLPDDLVELLRRAGWFRLLLPLEQGGLGADLPTGVDRLARLARADASTGWTVMIGAAGWCDLVGLDRVVFDELFGDPEATVAGVFNPTGHAVAVGAGYRVDGRWAYSSGCQHATWIYGNCISGDDGEIRTVVFEAEQVHIEESWDPPGLRGTGSHHVRADGVVVPGTRTFPTFTAEPCVDTPLVRIPVPALFAMLVASAAVGTARGAVDDLLALAESKVPLLDEAVLATNAAFHGVVGAAIADLDAAEVRLADLAATAWAGAVDGSTFDLTNRAHLRVGACWTVDRAVQVVEAAYRSAGSAVLHAGHPLARRFRDIQTLAQHFLVRADTVGAAGAAFAGHDVTMPVF